MRSRPLLARTLIAFAALAAAHGAMAAVPGFRLPPSPGSTPSQPEAQGPVAEDVPESQPTPTRPVPAPTPAPTPAPEPAATQAPTIVLPPTGAEQSPAAAPRPAPTTRAPTPQTPAQASTAPPAQPADTTEEPATTAEIAPVPFPIQPAAPAPSTLGEDADQQGWSGWLIALLAVIALLIAGAALWWRTNRPMLRPAAVPQIARPTPPPPPQPDPAPVPAPVAAAEPAPAPALPAGEALQVALQPRKLSLTLMNATLSYRLEIVNRGADAVSGLAVRADMIAAHASLSRAAQLAGPPLDLPPQHVVEMLAPGESRIIEGEFRLPFPEIVPIRQGSAALLLPLARFRVEAEGAAPLTRIFVVGQPGPQPDAALVPFRLDQGPRIYPQLAQRAFA